MSFGNTQVRLIDLAIQSGRGAAASVLGQTYDVRRMTPTTNVSISANLPIIKSFPSRIERITTRKAMENQTFDLLVFKATCDNRALQIGDTFTETGYKSDGGVYTLAQFRPTRETLWVRTEANVTISRMAGTAGQASQQPIQGAVATPGYSGTTKAGEEILTLIDGLYGFSSIPGSISAQVQVGLQPISRIQDGRSPKLPTTLYRERFMAYIPTLPGVMLERLDRLNFGTSDRYEVALLFNTDQTGLEGYICIVEILST